MVPIQGRVRECTALVEPVGRLLDIGCSSGWLAPVALARGVREYVGIDCSVSGAPPWPHATLIEGSALSLPFNDGAFDAVCLFDVMEHLPRGTEGAALKEAHRVLGTGGRLYLSTPHASALHTPLDPAWCFGHRHYRRATVVRLLESAGFHVDRLFVAGGVVECFDYLRLLLHKHLLQRPPRQSARVIRLIERSYGRDHRLGMTLFVSCVRS